MKVDDAPLAVTSEGHVFVNVTHVSGAKALSQLIAQAELFGGNVFVGIELNREEVEVLLERLGHGAREAAAYAIGGRQL